MKIIKIILNVLALLFGAALVVFSVAGAFKSLNGYTEAKDAYEVGYHTGYLIVSALFSWLGVFIFSKGLAPLQGRKEGEEPKEEVEN